MKFLPVLALFFCASALADERAVLERVQAYQACMHSYGNTLKGMAAPAEIADAASAKCEPQKQSVRVSYKSLIDGQRGGMTNAVDVRAARSLESQMDESIGYLESVTRRQVIALAIGA